MPADVVASVEPRGSTDAMDDVRLRRFPYPYKAMMAICSDLDETPDREVYGQIAGFLNTTTMTRMGQGVGLEVGNTIYFDMPQDQFSYWGTDEAGREMVRAMIHSGHIDCLHSYGDLATGRDDARRNIEELKRFDCKIEVWVDHSKAPSNFGPDIMVGSGDVADSRVYHADLTLDYGVRYVWRGRSTSMIGQDAPIDTSVFARMLNFRHPMSSSRAAAKEAMKVVLGRRGHARWEMYGANAVCRPSTLRDGRSIWEFFRSNPHWGGPGEGATADGIAEVLTASMLRALVDREGVCVLYTHLGKVSNPHEIFCEPTRAAFRRLAEEHHGGRIMVTTTRRLLRYLTVRAGLRYSASRVGDAIEIALESVDDPVSGARVPSPEDVEGMTFEAPRGSAVRIVLKGHGPVDSATVRRGDAGFVTIPWRRLTLPSFS